MKLGIIGKKVGMTLIFDDNGFAVPITVVDTSDCTITQVKTKEKDGYQAIQVGYGFRKPQNVDKAKMGHFKKAQVIAKANLRELRLTLEDDMSQLKPGQVLTAGMFAKGDKVDVVGTSKGKGFTGVMKRWGFHGCDASHGGHKYYRHGGSNGSNTFPGRVLKLKGMPGHKGDVRKTISNVKVVDVKPEQNLIFLKGGIPGSKNGILMIRPAKKMATPKDRTFVTAK